MRMLRLMRSTRFPIAVVAGALVKSRPLIQAQTSTADGVDAFVKGDHQRAAEILKPIAEAWPPRDPTAAFFMAMMYHSGLNGPADSVRACALYTRASSANPFEGQALSLLGPLMTSFSTEELQECHFLANIGFNHGFQPATFTLEPGHWISLDVRGATIAYPGTEKRIDLAPAWPPGVVFLPVEHTELNVGRFQSTRRHFIEFFMWVPAQDIRMWTLKWLAFEVVRDGLVDVAAEDLTTISAERPPTGQAVDVREMARLRVNEAGDAEWAVLGDPEPRSQRMSRKPTGATRKPRGATGPNRNAHARRQTRVWTGRAFATPHAHPR